MIYSCSVKTSSDAWNYAKSMIDRYGTNVISENGKMTRELCRLLIEIKNPSEGWPVKNSGWNLTALGNYANQLTDFSDNTYGFDYRYGQRIGNQIFTAIEILKENPTSRRSVVYLWMPDIDLGKTEHKPCMVMCDFKIRNEQLILSTVFRSHDIGRAYIPNLYGIAKLQELVSSEVGVLSGSISVFDISAHVYMD